MSAPVLDVMRLTGAASGLGATTNTAITSAVNLADAADSAADAGANPILIPASGSNFSFWVTTQIKWTSGTADMIFGLKVAMSADTSPCGPGVTCAGGITASGAQYVIAAGTAGTTGTQLTTGNYAAVATVYDDIFVSIGTAGISIDGSATGTGQFGGFFVYQLTVGSTAAAGYLTSWPSACWTNTWSYAYD